MIFSLLICHLRKCSSDFYKKYTILLKKVGMKSGEEMSICSQGETLGGIAEWMTLTEWIPL